MLYSDEAKNRSYEFIVWDQQWTKTRVVTQARRMSNSKNDKGEDVSAIRTVT
jgi:hypothetical protein